MPFMSYLSVPAIVMAYEDSGSKTMCLKKLLTHHLKQMSSHSSDQILAALSTFSSEYSYKSPKLSFFLSFVMELQFSSEAFDTLCPTSSNSVESLSYSFFKNTLMLRIHSHFHGRTTQFYMFLKINSIYSLP